MADPQGPGLAPEVEALITKRASDAVDAKLGQYRRALRWFLAGFGVFLAVIIGTGLVTRANLIRMLHDQIFGFEASLDRVLDKTVAVSYSNGFWLSTSPDDDREHAVAFYADTTQRVQAYVDIFHTGAGDPLEVTVRLEGSDQPMLSATADESGILDVTDWMQRHSHDLVFRRRDRNVHLLVFRVTEPGEENNDRVFVRSLITVSGRERSTS